MILLPRTNPLSIHAHRPRPDLPMAPNKSLRRLYSHPCSVITHAPPARARCPPCLRPAMVPRPGRSTLRQAATTTTPTHAAAVRRSKQPSASLTSASSSTPSAGPPTPEPPVLSFQFPYHPSAPPTPSRPTASAASHGRKRLATKKSTTRVPCPNSSVFSACAVHIAVRTRLGHLPAVTTHRQCRAPATHVSSRLAAPPSPLLMTTAWRLAMASSAASSGPVLAALFASSNATRTA